MFWVVTEVCSEHNLLRRMRIIKQFIKVASKYKIADHNSDNEMKNYCSSFYLDKYFLIQIESYILSGY